MILRLLICFLLIQHASSGIFDGIKNKLKELQNKVEEEIKKLDKHVKDLIKDAKKFAGIGVDNLKNMKQDILSNLETVIGMSKGQFNSLKARLKNFRSDNLESFLGNVNFTLIKDNFLDLAVSMCIDPDDIYLFKFNNRSTRTMCETSQKLTKKKNEAWEKVQLNVIAKVSLRQYGENVAAWTKDQIKSLKTFLAGLPSHNFARFSTNALNESLDEFCNIGLKFQQKLNLLVASTKIFGNVEQWDNTTVHRLCENIEALSPDEILKIPSHQISRAITKFTQYAFSESQREAILKKIKNHIGDIKSFTKEQFKSLKDLVRNLDIEDIKNLTREQLKELKDISWDKIQSNEFLKKLKQQLGGAKNWTTEYIENAFKSLPELDSDLNETVSKIWNVISQKSKQAKWKLKQGYLLLKNDPVKFKDLVKKDIVDRAQFIQSYLKSEIAKIPKQQLLDALQEIKEEVKASEPVLRHIVSEFKQQTTQGIDNLGQFIKGLSRYELSTKLKDILNKTENINLDVLSKSHIAEIMQKIREQLGNLNATDLEDADIMKWGFQNFKKMGKVALALTRKELEKFPLTGIESSLDILGKHNGWARRKVIAIANRIKEYWNETKKTLSTLDESDIELLGAFVQGLKMEDLNQLNETVIPMVIELLGKFDGLPEDKLKERAEFAFNFLKNLHNGEVTSSDLRIMGNLLAGLSEELIQTIKGSILYSNAKDLLMQKMSKEKLRDYFDAVKSQIKNGDISTWTADDFRKVLSAIKTLDVNEIKSIRSDVFMLLLNEIAETSGLDATQKQAIIEKVKEIYGDVQTWKGALLDKLKSVISVLKESDITKMTKQQITEMVGKLGDSEFKQDAAMKFVKTLKKLGYANITEFSIETLKQLQNVLTGYSIEDVKNVIIDNVDKLDLYGTIGGWTMEQLKELKEKAKEFLKNSGNNNDYTSLKNLIKGFNKTDIEGIPDEAFKIAAGKFGAVKNMDVKIAKELVKKAKKVWNNKWTDALVSETGQFLVGLDKADIPNLPETAMEYINPEVIKRMTGEQINAFNIDQLSELNTAQIQAIEPEIRKSLPPAKAQALVSVENEEGVQNPGPTGGSDASSIKSSSFMFLSMCTMVFTIMLW